MRSLFLSSRRFTATAVIGLVSILSPYGTRATPLQTQITAGVNLMTPLTDQDVAVGGTLASLIAQGGSPIPGPTLLSGFSIPASDSVSSGTASFAFTAHSLSSPTLANASNFTVTATAANVVNPPVPAVAVPSLVTSSTTFLSFDTWTINPAFASVLATTVDPSHVTFNGNTYDLSNFGIQVSASFDFNYDIQGNALARVQVNLAGQAFPDADVSTGFLGTGAGLSQITETCTTATNPAVVPATATDIGIAAISTGCTPGTFQGTAFIDIPSGETGTDALAGLLGLGVPDVVDLNFDLSAVADASGNDFNSSFPDVEAECDSSTNPNCVIASAGANTANAQSIDPDITSINIVDANGQIVPFFTFQSVDGLSLPDVPPTPASSSVPEPGSLAILSSALFALGWLRRRTRHV